MVRQRKSFHLPVRNFSDPQGLHTNLRYIEDYFKIVIENVDHGETLGLTDDDHTQYLKEKASGGTAAETPTHDHSGAAEAGTVSHDDLTGVSADDHHNEAHTVASHSDTTATGAELETLTDGSDADALHTHGGIQTDEEIADVVGGMVTGNTETLIAVTYQDVDNTLDFVVDEASIDHGSIAGLADDDHTQYLNTTRHDTQHDSAKAEIASPQTIAHNTTTAINLATELWDTNGSIVELANDRFVIQTAGIYTVTAWVNWASSTTGARRLNITVGGSAVSRSQIGASGTSSHAIGTTLNLAVNDLVQVTVLHTHGSNLDINNAELAVTRLRTAP